MNPIVKAVSVATQDPPQGLSNRACLKIVGSFLFCINNCSWVILVFLQDKKERMKLVSPKLQEVYMFSTDAVIQITKYVVKVMTGSSRTSTGIS